MALKQQVNGSYDALTKYSEQQLRSILVKEMDSEDVDYELVKSITDVLAAKTDVRPFDPESSYQLLMSEYAETDPLFDEALEGPGYKAEAPISREDASEQEGSKKVIHFSRKVKIGLLVAAIVALLCVASVGASAMGFNILHAQVNWDSDNLGVSSVGGVALNSDDPYQRIREAIEGEHISEQIVPTYLPDGYTLRDLAVSETKQGRMFDAYFSNNGDMIFLSYSVNAPVYNEFYPKDEAEPEIYTVNGIDHYITINEGKYRAIWGNGTVICDISGVDSKEELLKIINSIYEDR